MELHSINKELTKKGAAKLDKAIDIQNQRSARGLFNRLFCFNFTDIWGQKIDQSFKCALNTFSKHLVRIRR